MPSVNIAALVPGMRAEEVFDTVADFAHYPSLVDIVRTVEVGSPRPDGALPSRWEVLFRNGILRWLEVDWFDRDQLSILFEQIEGDFDTFTGRWRLRQAGEGVTVTFEAEFDFGVASMAAIIDPVAVRVLTETIWVILHGLFDNVTDARMTQAPS